VRVLIAHSFYRVPGGEDRYVNEQVQLLAGRHQVDLLGARNTELAHGPRTAATMTFSPTKVRAVEARIRAFKPDVIHLHNLYPSIGPAVHLAAKRQNVPLVMTVHNLRLRCPNGLMFTQGKPCRRCEAGNYLNAVAHRCFPSPSQSSAYALALWMHRFLLRLEQKVDLFLTPSIFMQHRLQEWGISEGRTDVVRNFVASPPEVPGSGTFGIYVGRLSVEKGLDILLRALSVAGDPPFQIVGDGPMQHDVMALARRLDLKRTEFTGRLSPSEVAAKMLEARFLAMPSQCDENAPLSVLEAMASGRPVLISRRGGLPELVERGGGLVTEAGDVQGLASNVRLLMTDDGLCSTLGGQALGIARDDFSAERHLSRLEAAYEKACTGVPRVPR
jgi:glycosyltransferase involved in cell wall biosynthesis